MSTIQSGLTKVNVKNHIGNICIERLQCSHVAQLFSISYEYRQNQAG